MATEEGGGSSSSQKGKQLMQEALLEANGFLQKLEQDLEELTSLKQNDESTEKAICDSIEERRIKFIRQFSLLISSIASQKDVEIEIMSSIFKMIASFKKKHNEATMAQIEKRQQQMKWAEFNVDALIFQLANASSQGKVCENCGQANLVLCSTCNKYAPHVCNKDTVIQEGWICDVCDPKQKRPLNTPAMPEKETKRPKVILINDEQAINLSKRKSVTPKTYVTKGPAQPDPKNTSDHPVVGSKKVETEVKGKLATMPTHSAHLPSGVEIWRGGFSLFGEIYGTFEAQPRWTVSRRAYEFSKSMPRELEVVLLPIDHVWNILFKNRTPELSDVALYFLPSNIERSEDNYIGLLGRLETDGSVVISWIGHVALMICTSKQLNADSRVVAEGWIRENFMWGVLAAPKTKFELPTEMELY